MGKFNVVFYTIHNSNEKVRYLLQVIEKHFSAKEKIQILLPDDRAISFVSSLLWTHKKEAFLPHTTFYPNPFHDLIYLCLADQASVEIPFVFNLCPNPYFPHSGIKTFYELEDCTHPTKKALFRIKFDCYQKQNYTVSHAL